jgi:hypothetical protein
MKGRYKKGPHLKLVGAVVIALVLIAILYLSKCHYCSELKDYLNCQSDKKADIVPVLDTTGSMHDNIADMSSNPG